MQGAFQQTEQGNWVREAECPCSELSEATAERCTSTGWVEPRWSHSRFQGVGVGESLSKLEMKPF